MAVRDEIKQEHAKVKEMSWKKKLEYFWEYYKIPTLILLVVIIAGVSLTRDIIEGSKPVYLDVTFINTNFALDNSDCTLEQDYIEAEGIDMETYNVNISVASTMRTDPETYDQVSLATKQKIMALYTGKMIDILAGPKAVVDNISELDGYGDLDTILPDDIKQELEKKGYEKYYCTTQEGNTIWGGIYLDKCDYFNNMGELGMFPAADSEENRPILTISVCAQNVDHCLSFLRMIMK